MVAERESLQSTKNASEGMMELLRGRHSTLESVDLTAIAPLLVAIREALPPASFKFLLTLTDPVFNHLDEEHCVVPVMTKKVEAALSALQKVVARGTAAATETPDRLFDKLAGACSSMLRDVVPDHEKCVRDARARAVNEIEAAEQAAAAQDKAAAKQAKKEKMRREAAERKERLAAKNQGAKHERRHEERTSGGSGGSASEPAETGSREASASSN